MPVIKIKYDFIILISICVFFAACDPYYRINYCVRNKTPDTVYVKFMNYPDSLAMVRPDSTVIIKSESGVGFAKSKYKTGTFQKHMSQNAVIVRKGSDDKLKKVSDTKWKYEGHRIQGNAILQIQN